MTNEAKAVYNAYMRDWRKKNPKKNAEYKAAYWERKAAELLKTEAQPRGEKKNAENED